MFSHIMDQKEQKGKWYKFGSQTLRYKPHPTNQSTYPHIATSISDGRYVDISENTDICECFLRCKIDISEVIWADRCRQVNPGAASEAREEINERHPGPTEEYSLQNQGNTVSRIYKYTNSTPDKYNPRGS